MKLKRYTNKIPMQNIKYLLKLLIVNLKFFINKRTSYNDI